MRHRDALLLAVLVMSTMPLPAQEVATAGAQRATRAQLAERVAQLEQQVAEGRLRGGARTRTVAELAATRKRLQTGDFRVGDRFIVTVRQDSVVADTVLVRDSLKVAVLNVPDASLVGVLRSELDERMSAHMARYLRNVSVRTSVLTRVAITGAVVRPGFYYASPDGPVSDLVMLAGGPLPNANLNQLEISRGSAKIVRSKESKRLIDQGRTLEQLDVQSGDEVRIPQKRKINWQVVIQLAFIILSLVFAFLQFLQWYYNRQDS
jgi:hypothetical protein